MGRPINNTFTYYPRDCLPSDDFKLFLAECKQRGIPKMTAQGIFDRLEGNLMWHGFYLRFGGDYPLLYADELDVSLEVLMKVVDVALDKDLFDKHLYENHRILTSERYQRRYLRQRTRSKSAVLVPAFMLIAADEEGFSFPADTHDPLLSYECVRMKTEAAGRSALPPPSYDMQLALDAARRLDPTNTKRR